ncbi:hypothetical protein HD554DRAFT_2172804 [Boletus coccyginus]|nr:hypothetical protein HD554DRAFT_2172804 [Boletus coccyginus]
MSYLSNFLFCPKPSIVHLILLLLALLLQLLSHTSILWLLTSIHNFYILHGHLFHRPYLLLILHQYLFVVPMLIITSNSSSIHQCLVQSFPICPIQFPLRNESSFSTLPDLTYLPTSNPGLTEVSIPVFHGLTLVLPLDLVRSPLTNISDRFSTPPLMLENNTVITSVNKNINPNNMVFIINEIMEPDEIIDLDQAMNPLQIDLTLNNWLVMFPKNVFVPTRIQRHQTVSYRDNLMH